MNSSQDDLLQAYFEVEGLDDPEGKSAKTPSCLPMSRLDVLGRGRRSVVDSERRHLESCEFCQARLGAFERETLASRGGKTLSLGHLTMAVAAIVLVALTMFLFKEGEDAESSLQVDVTRVRGEASTFTVTYALEQSSVVRLAVLDDRGELWFLYVDDRERYQDRFDSGTHTITHQVEPPTGAERGAATHVLVMVSEAEAPTAETLAEVLADPFVDVAGRSPDEIDELLREAIGSLMATYSLNVLWGRLP